MRGLGTAHERNAGRLRDAIALRSMNARDRRAIVVGLAVLVPVLLYTAVVRPYRAALHELRDRTATELALLERELALIASAPVLPAGVEAAQIRAQSAGMRLVRASNLPLAEAEVTGMLENIALLSSVLLQEMRAVEPRTAGDVAASLRPLWLAVRGESDLEGVITFLQRIEGNPLLLRVIELSMEPVREGNSRTGDHRMTGVVQFAVTIEAFAPAEEVTS
jgi:hypothetical protein